MDGKKLVDLALELGFADAAIIDTDKLVFVPAFRTLCEENQCGKYGVNYACPPACGTVEEMKEKVLCWKQALVMQTMWDIEDPLDSAQIKPAKSAHNQLTRQLIDQVDEPGLMIGVSGCSLCDPCAITTGEPCRFPKMQCSCMSAYCIFVKEMTALCHMDYECAPGITTFFSMFCFDKRDS
ncbi:MAG: DUF2284 domain-containing protein [Lachnospiraceae bacterium]|nr:DUF2284 domain-containing protein [Lachnospiraceae bacterium]